VHFTLQTTAHLSRQISTTAASLPNPNNQTTSFKITKKEANVWIFKFFYFRVTKIYAELKLYTSNSRFLFRSLKPNISKCLRIAHIDTPSNLMSKSKHQPFWFSLIWRANWNAVGNKWSIHIKICIQTAANWNPRQSSRCSMYRPCRTHPSKQCSWNLVKPRKQLQKSPQTLSIGGTCFNCRLWNGTT